MSAMNAWPEPSTDDVDALRAQVIDLTRRCALLAAAAAPNRVDDGLIERTIVEALQPIVGHELAMGCAAAVRAELDAAGLLIVVP